MSLIKFHRVLIVTFILMCGVLGWVLWQRWDKHGATTDLAGAVGSAVVGIGCGFYLRTVGRKHPKI